MNEGLGPEGSYYEAKEREETARRKRKTDAAWPVTVTALYLILGFFFDLWHPGWLIFLTIPLQYLQFDSLLDRLLHPVSITLIYLVLGFFFDLWHPGWLIFLAVPAGRAIRKS